MGPVHPILNMKNEGHGNGCTHRGGCRGCPGSSGCGECAAAWAWAAAALSCILAEGYRSCESCCCCCCCCCCCGGGGGGGCRVVVAVVVSFSLDVSCIMTNSAWVAVGLVMVMWMVEMMTSMTAGQMMWATSPLRGGCDFPNIPDK